MGTFRVQHHWPLVTVTVYSSLRFFVSSHQWSDRPSNVAKVVRVNLGLGIAD